MDPVSKSNILLDIDTFFVDSTQITWYINVNHKETHIPLTRVIVDANSCLDMLLGRKLEKHQIEEKKGLLIQTTSHMNEDVP